MFGFGDIIPKLVTEFIKTRVKLLEILQEAFKNQKAYHRYRGMIIALCTNKCSHTFTPYNMEIGERGTGLRILGTDCLRKKNFQGIVKENELKIFIIKLSFKL